MGLSFSHLLLVFFIALVVLGPKKLPKLVTQIGRWAGKARAMARQFREQLENEINLEELNKTPSRPASTSASAEPTPAAEPMPWHQPAAEAPAAEAAPAHAPAAAEAPATEGTPADAPAAAEVPAGDALADVLPAPAVMPLHHENTIHAAPPPETQAATPIIETHERGS